MKLFIKIVSVLSMLLIFNAKAYAVDVYITYMAADKDIKQSIQAALPTELKVKYYNASSLIMADYSGKQKAIAKLSKAALVIIVKARTMDILESPSFTNYIIVNSADEAELAKIKAKL